MVDGAGQGAAHPRFDVRLLKPIDPDAGKQLV
jgi:hypothetical protein